MKSSRVNVAFVIDTLARGGAERVAVTLANSLDVHRFRPCMITTRWPGELAGELSPHVQQFSLERRTRWQWNAIRRFAHFLDQQEIHVVHSHNHSSSYLVRAARMFSRRPWRHVMHDHHGPVESSRWLPLLDRLLVRKVDYYFAVSERLVDYAAQRVGIPAARCQYLSNAVLLPATIDRPPAQPLTIVQVGRFVPEKDQLLAIEIAARLRKRVPDFRWLLVGRCDRDCAAYAQRCRDAIARHGLQAQVVLTGERADVADWLRQAHVGVLTSRYEGLPVALLEYMAWSLPVVVSDVGACRSAVGPSPGGVVAPAGHIDSFVDALAQLAQDADRRDRWGRQNRARAQTEYSAAAMANRVMTTYEHLLRRSGHDSC